MRFKTSASSVVLFHVEGTDGTLVDADSLPSGKVYRNGADSGVTVTVASVTGTGKYSASWTNGAWDNGDAIQLEIDATVDGTSYARIVSEGVIDAENVIRKGEANTYTNNTSGNSDSVTIS